MLHHSDAPERSVTLAILDTTTEGMLQQRQVEISISVLSTAVTDREWAGVTAAYDSDVCQALASYTSSAAAFPQYAQLIRLYMCKHGKLNHATC